MQSDLLHGDTERQGQETLEGLLRIQVKCLDGVLEDEPNAELERHLASGANGRRRSRWRRIGRWRCWRWWRRRRW